MSADEGKCQELNAGAGDAAAVESRLVQPVYDRVAVAQTPTQRFAFELDLAAERPRARAEEIRWDGLVREVGVGETAPRSLPEIGSPGDHVLGYYGSGAHGGQREQPHYPADPGSRHLHTLSFPTSRGGAGCPAPLRCRHRVLPDERRVRCVVCFGSS